MLLIDLDIEVRIKKLIEDGQYEAALAEAPQEVRDSVMRDAEEGGTIREMRAAFAEGDTFDDGYAKLARQAAHYGQLDFALLLIAGYVAVKGTV